MWIIKELRNVKNGGVVIIDKHSFETYDEARAWKKENEQDLIKQRIALVSEQQ